MDIKKLCKKNYAYYGPIDLGEKLILNREDYSPHIWRKLCEIFGLEAGDVIAISGSTEVFGMPNENLNNLLNNNHIKK